MVFHRLKTSARSLALAGLFLLLASPLEGRTFTYRNGRKVEAELVGMAGAQVTFRIEGRTMKVSINRFSAADQKFIRESLVIGDGPYPPTAPPQEAIDAGYRLRTFASEFRSKTVDVGDTKRTVSNGIRGQCSATKPILARFTSTKTAALPCLALQRRNIRSCAR